MPQPKFCSKLVPRIVNHFTSSHIKLLNYDEWDCVMNCIALRHLADITHVGAAAEGWSREQRNSNLGQRAPNSWVPMLAPTDRPGAHSSLALSRLP